MYNHEIENKVENQTGNNLVDLLSKHVLKRLVTEHPELSDLPPLIGMVLAKTLSYPEIEKTELTGSMARFAAGFGSIEKYWEGKDGAKELLEQLPNSSPDSEKNGLKDIVATLTNSDVDMDLCFGFKDNHSLVDLFGYLKQSFFAAPEYSETEKGFSVGLGANYHMNVIYEPVLSNPRFKIINIGFSSFDQNTQKNIMHIDMSEFPRTGIEGREQKRHGGRSVRSQDKCRLPLESSDGGVVYKITDEAKFSLYGRETIGIYGRNVAGVAELGLRALRIRLIHTPDALPIKINYLSPFMDYSSLFLIRKSIQEYVVENKKSVSLKDMNLPLKDLVLCFNYDPYITLQFLQDSNLYMLFPDLQNLSARNWRNLYLNDWLNLSTEDGWFVATEKRSLTSLVKDQYEYKRRGLKNGFVSTLQAISEINNIEEEFNLEKSLKSFVSGESTKFNIEGFAGSAPTKAISLIMNQFKGGLTEVEIHRNYNSIHPHKLNNDSFRQELRKLKLNSKIDKQLRKIQVRGNDRSVILYNLNISGQQTPCGGLESLLIGYKDKVQHPYTNRAKEYLNESSENSKIIEEYLVEIFDSLRIFGVKSLEALRSFSNNDLADVYAEYPVKKLSLKDYQIGCRMLQIISEDILRNPQFYKKG